MTPCSGQILRRQWHHIQTTLPDAMSPPQALLFCKAGNTTRNSNRQRHTPIQVLKQSLTGVKTPFSTACHPPLFLVENADAKSADLWAFACRFSTMLKISTKKLPDFPAFSTGANALSTGVSRVFHRQWSFLTGKQQKGIRRTDTPRFALRARHSRESRRLRLRFSPLRSEKFLLRHCRSLPLQRPPDAPTGAQFVCVLTKQHDLHIQPKTNDFGYVTSEIILASAPIDNTNPTLYLPAHRQTQNKT